jgi:hypothetical protein
MGKKPEVEKARRQFRELQGEKLKTLAVGVLVKLEEEERLALLADTGESNGKEQDTNKN